MFNFLKSIETRRIEFLFQFYKSLLSKGLSDENARLDLIGELKMTTGPVKNQFEDWDAELKKQELDKLFIPLEIREYEIFKLINFIITWEFSTKYNYMPSVEQIRSNKHAQAYLGEKVKKIGEHILK